MSTLPLDVITDILCRLPVKSLLRFRCVSTSWCSLIDSTDFVKLHLDYSIKTRSNLSLILEGSKPEYSVDLDLLDAVVKLDVPLRGIESTSVFGSCDGLLALVNHESGMAIWNPSTRKCRYLAKFWGDDSYRERYRLGFGYDAVSDDYKVVALKQFDGKDQIEAMVCNLKSNSWRRIDDFPYYVPYNAVGEYGALAGGALHWLAMQVPYSDEDVLIVAFDIGREEFHELPQPDYTDRDFCGLSLEVLEGCVSVICEYLDFRFDVWVMKAYGVEESWTKLFSLSKKKLFQDITYITPLAYSKDGGKVLLKDDKDIYWRHIDNKRIESVWISGTPKCFTAKIFVGGLASVNA